MKWLLAGASGFLGSALRRRLAARGDEVVRLVRRAPAGLDEIGWDPAAGQLDPRALAGVDTVVNLCGVAVFPLPWTARRRAAILSSRVDPGQTLARAIAGLPGADKPTLIQAGGVARYGGIAGPQPFTEDDLATPDFLAQVTVRWEAAARPAAEAGGRVVILRTSPVLDRSGGMFHPMKLAWSLGLGATLGNGRQRMALIALADYLRVVDWAASTPDARGAYNLTIPVPCTNREFTDELARALHRPRFLAAPEPVLHRLLGEQAEHLLGDQWIVPHRLTEQGFEFAAPDVRAVVASALSGAA